jgi:plasmid stabilization system protein ParE
VVQKIIWSPEARAGDSGNVAREIAQHRPDFAGDYCLRLVEKMEAIAPFPFSGRMFPGQASSNLRELVLPPHRVIYELWPEAGRLDVLRVWDACRGDPEFVRLSPA